MRAGLAVGRDAGRVNVETGVSTCGICGVALTPGESLRKDCGGDCLLCMADAGDPSCIETAYRLLKSRQENPMHTPLNYRDKGQMTVAELVEELLKQPQDALVWKEDDFSVRPVTEVKYGASDHSVLIDSSLPL